MDDDFFRYYAKLYAEKFSVYLGCVPRYLMNRKLHDIPYQG